MMTLSSRSAPVIMEGISKCFGPVAAVDRIDLTIEAGTLVTLLGPSGCGKTTTLRMIAGLEAPSSGRVLIGDRDVTLLPPNERDVSMVFQSYALFPHMTVMENVAYGLQKSQLSKTERRDKGTEGLRLVGLEGFDNRLPSELSGGQQQRVAVARALVLEPQVLLFDEPLSNLDAKLRRRMRDDIRELQTKLGLTSVYVTHDQEEALAVSDKVVVMDKGRIAQAGSPAELYERPVSAFVADFVGSANLIPVEIIDRDTVGGKVTVNVGKKRIEVADRGYPWRDAYLVVRPNAIELDAPPGNDVVAAKILKATYLGSHWEYSIDVAGHSIFAVQPGSADQKHKTEIRIRFEPGRLALVARP